MFWLSVFILLLILFDKPFSKVLLNFSFELSFCFSDFKVSTGLKRLELPLLIILLSKDILLEVLIILWLFIFFAVSNIISLSKSFSLKVDNFGSFIKLGIFFTVFDLKFSLSEEVNVIPQPHAGGAFAVEAYSNFREPIVVESINARADAGIDIGGVMVGMHIHPVVVPLRLENRNIGRAIVVAARRRPKYVGGVRAVYNDSLE